MKIFCAFFLYICTVDILLSQVFARRAASLSRPLIEVFNGIQCGSCPSGDVMLNNIQKLKCTPSIVKLPTGKYAIPLNKTQLDFRTSFGDSLHSYFVNVDYLTALINRSSFRGFNYYYIGDWTHFINTQLQVMSPVNIGIQSQYDFVKNQFNIDIEVFYTDSVAELQNYLNIYIVENKIFGYQKMENGDDNYNYEHNHVFRSSLTGQWGDTLINLSKNKSIRKRYFYKPGAEILNINNLQITAFITASKSNVYTSSTINAKQGFDGIVAEGKNWQEETTLLGDLESKTTKMYVYNKLDKPQEFSINVTSALTPNMSLKINIGDSIYSKPKNFWLQKYDSIMIKTVVTKDDNPGYGKVTIDVKSLSEEAGCDPPIFKKPCYYKLGCGNVVLIKNENLRFDGLANTIDLEYPIKRAIKNIKCKNYCDLKESEMMDIGHYLDTSCKSIVIYALGWGRPALSDSVVRVFERLMDREKLDLFIHGQDAAFQLAGPSSKGSLSTDETRNFLNNYLFTNYFDNGDSTRNTVGHTLDDTLFHINKIVPIEPVYKTAQSLNLNPDRAYSTNINSINFLQYPKFHIAGIYGWQPKYKYMYMGVGLEMFPSDSVFTQELVNGALRFFNILCVPETVSNNNYQIKPKFIIENIDAISKLIIRPESNFLKDYTVSIFSVDGRLLLQNQIYKGTTCFEYNINNWPHGIYLVHLKTIGEQALVKKIIKI